MLTRGRTFIQRASSSRPHIWPTSGAASKPLTTRPRLAHWDWHHVPNSSKNICSCFANKHHKNRIFDHQQSQAIISRLLHLVESAQAHGQLVYTCRQLRSVVGFARTLSSLAGADGPHDGDPSEEVDIGDSFDEVTKELDAEGLGPRKNVKNKQSAAVSKDSLRSVGKLVPDKIVTLLDQDGVMLGSVHRTEAIKRSQQSGLKLVLINQKSHPYPTYRLMTGQQLHQEQMHLNEKLKTKSAHTQIKEVKVSGNIGRHDLEVKKRHMQDWFEDDRAHTHVKVTVTRKGKHQKEVNKEQQMAIIQHLMSGLEDKITFSSKPKDTGKDGQNLMVVLRPMSAKEKSSYVKQQNKEESLKRQEINEETKNSEEKV